MAVSNVTTLLPFRGDLDNEVEDADNFNFKGMNIILKLNTEQIFALLGSYSSNKVKLRAVIKDGKINGLRIVHNPDTSTTESVTQKKVEIIKCNLVKETNGTIYHKIHKGSIADKGDSYAVNLGQLDYRLNLINYKPNITSENVENVTKFRNIVKIIEFIAQTIGPNGESDRTGLYYDQKDILGQLIKEKIFSIEDKNEILGIFNLLKPMEKENTDMVEWKWFKLIRSFTSTKWIKKLFQEGYRSNDSYSMIYSGRVDNDMIRKKSKTDNVKNKKNSKEEVIYIEESEPTSPISNYNSQQSNPTASSASSKSSESSNHSTFSRSSSVETSESRHTTPPIPEESIDEVLEAKSEEEGDDLKQGTMVGSKTSKEDSKDFKASKEVEDVITETTKTTKPSKEIRKTTRSFKEYRLSKGLNSANSSTPASPLIVDKTTEERTFSSNSVDSNASVTIKSIPRKRKIENEGRDSVKEKEFNRLSQEPEPKKLNVLPKGPRSAQKLIENDKEAVDLINIFQNKYVIYHILYQKLRNRAVVNEEGNAREKDLMDINKSMTELVELHNELENIKWRLSIYSTR